MSICFVPNKDKIWNRRQFLKLGLVGAGASGAGLLWLSLNRRSNSQILIPPIDTDIFNGQVPGPTLRAKVGDRVRIIFRNQGGHSHSIHFHGTHPASSDGILPVRNGKRQFINLT